MPQYEQRLYEPSDEARAFDGGEDEFNEEEGSRLPLLIVIALVVLASFAGVVWIAYTQGVQRGRENAPRAQSTQQQGASAETQRGNPYAKLEIYKAAKPQADTSVASPIVPEMSAASTPKPDAGSKSSFSEAVRAGQPPRQGIARSPNKPPSVAQQARAPVAKLVQTQKPREGASSAPVATQTSPATGNPRPITPGGMQAGARQASAASSGPTQIVNPAAQTPGSLAQGSYVLQIGSYPSAAEANASWQSYKQAHASVSGYAPDIQSADLGKRGTWYRLRIGPFSSLAEATAACARLKAQGSSCLAAKR